MNNESKSTLYGAIKLEYADRARARENLVNHPDRQADWDLHTKVIADLIRDYKAAGGKRDVERFR